MCYVYRSRLRFVFLQILRHVWTCGVADETPGSKVTSVLVFLYHIVFVYLLTR